MGRLSKTEATARGLFSHYLPQLKQVHNIRPTTKPGAKPYQFIQARLYGFDLKGLELDIYFPETRTGIEVDGIQHKRPVEFFTKGDLKVFEDQQWRDARKIELCKQQGVILHHLDIFDLTQREFEPFIRDLMKQHGWYEQYRRTTPPRVLYVQAEKLSRAKFKPAAKQSEPSGQMSMLQKLWRWLQL